MLEAALNVSAQPMLEFLTYAEVMGREGNRSSHAAPQGVYPTADEGEWLAVSVVDDAQWQALALHIGGVGLADDPRFSTHAGRAAGHDELDAVIAHWVSARNAVEAADELCAEGVPAGTCRDPRLTRRHPQYVARGLFETNEHPVVGRVELPTQPYRATGVDSWLTRGAPTFGQHNVEVLLEAGFERAEIEALVERGILAGRPRGV